MRNKVIFVAGIYGVGKTTICNDLSKKLNIPHYSASDLISAKNNEKYGSNKSVVSVANNQQFLIDSINEILAKEKSIILSGHFAIISHGKIVEIEQSVFNEIGIGKILLLQADIKRVCSNIWKRDAKQYDENLLKELSLVEEASSQKVAHNIRAGLITHMVKFDSKDSDVVANLLKEML